MKSHVGCRLVRKLATLNELEHRNGHVVCVISPNLLAFWTYYIKVVEDTQIQSGVKCSPKNLVFSDIITYGDIRRGSPQRER